MKTELLRNYFKKILEGTGGNNSSNPDIIDYSNRTSISINDLKEEYDKYISLSEKIDDYTDNNGLDDVLDQKEIKKHFLEIDEDLFEFNQAVLKDFDEYMIIKINKKNKNIRKANLMFNKNGNGFTTTRISIPVPWAKELGFTEDDRTAIIELKKNEIIIKKEDINMLLIKRKDVKNSLGHYIDYVLEDGTEFYEMDWNGEKFLNGFKNGKDTNCTYKPVYRFQAENIDLDTLEENSDEWNEACEIIGFEEF